MKTKFAVILISLIMLACQAFAGSSTSYKITTEVLDSGGISGTSTSYHVLGKTRGHQTGSSSTTGLIVGTGFLKSAYFGVFALAPVVTSITPSTGLNSGTVDITDLAG